MTVDGAGQPSSVTNWCAGWQCGGLEGGGGRRGGVQGRDEGSAALS